MAHILSELRNEIYDEANSIGDISSLGTKDGSMPYTLLLGVFVSLIPKIVPKIMPSFIRNQEQRERFNDEEYQKEIEEVFVQRFVENLQLFEKMVLAWKDNSLTFADLGLSPDNPLAKNDVLIAGEPGGFQDELLDGIRFLKKRAERINRKDDKISQIADTVWNVMNMAYTTILDYLRS